METRQEIMDDLEWLEKYWHYYYKNKGFVGEYLFEERTKTHSRTVKEIIREMRDYQKAKKI